MEKEFPTKILQLGRNKPFEFAPISPKLFMPSATLGAALQSFSKPHRKLSNPSSHARDISDPTHCIRRSSCVNPPIPRHANLCSGYPFVFVAEELQKRRS
eukprot:scaffold60145_cov27-Attheya_sp.AAC.1